MSTNSLAAFSLSNSMCIIFMFAIHGLYTSYIVLRYFILRYVTLRDVTLRDVSLRDVTL